MEAVVIVQRSDDQGDGSGKEREWRDLGYNLEAD